MESEDDSLYKYHSHASASFFITYFMDDKATTIVNHNLCFYSISFFLTRIENLLSSFIICWSRNTLFYVQSMKDRKPPGKYFSTSCGVFSLLVILYIFCGIDGKQFLISGSIFCISWQILLWLGLNEKPAIEYRLCKGDNKQVD